MSVEIVRLAYRLDQPAGQGAGVLRLVEAELENCELVAAETGDGVAVADAGVQPLGDGA
jgi:hypothetical protein